LAAENPLLPQSQTENPPDEAQLAIQVDVPAGTRLTVTITARAPDGSPLGNETVAFTAPPAPPKAPSWFARQWPKLNQRQTLWAAALVALSLLIYLSVRLVGLEEFPIYFFTDEAIQTTSAQELVNNHYVGPGGDFMPTYFDNGGQLNLSLSVYAQVIPYLLFGKSIFVTRAISVLISLLGALAVFLTLKNIYRSRWAWTGILVLSVTPAWFLHTRTAFETVLATAFYAFFLYAYSMYRNGHPRWLFAAVLAGALSFYSYSPEQVILVVTALALLIADWRYHLRHLRLVGLAFAFALILAIPYLRFQIVHPDETKNHLLMLGSYWLDTIPFNEKVGRYLLEYLHGLNPYYWFRLDPEGLVRHMIKGYGYLWLPAAPFAFLGLILSLARLRKPEYRTLIIAMLVIPSGAALVEVGITRLLSMVIPYALLTVIGLSWTLDLLAERMQRRRLPGLPAFILSAAMLLALGGANIYLLVYSLQGSGTWYQEYGLGGMQYGQRQVFGAIKQLLKENPGQKIMLSPAWMNGTDIVAYFFFDEPLPFELGSINGFIDRYQPLDPNYLFIITPEELIDIENSGKFTDVQIQSILNYPNGQPGFYFLHLRYVDTIQEIFATQEAQRLTLQTAQVTLQDGTQAEVAYNNLDIGSIQELFDKSDASVTRTTQINPQHLEITFAEPRTLQSVEALIGGVATQMTVRVYTPGSDTPEETMVQVGATPSPRYISAALSQPVLAERVIIEVLNMGDDDRGNVHLWEVRFQ
jgi:hypothetical protein